MVSPTQLVLLLLLFVLTQVQAKALSSDDSYDRALAHAGKFPPREVDDYLEQPLQEYFKSHPAIEYYKFWYLVQIDDDGNHYVEGGNVTDAHKFTEEHLQEVLDLSSGIPEEVLAEAIYPFWIFVDHGVYKESDKDCFSECRDLVEDSGEFSYIPTGSDKARSWYRRWIGFFPKVVRMTFGIQT